MTDTDQILLVGLGNPGDKYAKTRHNIGFMVADFLKHNGLPANTKLLKPENFMNLSGLDVAKAQKYYKIKTENIWIIQDDIDLNFGQLRIRFGGSSGGHNGIKSIIEELDSPNFWRIKVGVSRPNENIPTDIYVLSQFGSGEAKDLPSIIDQIGQFVLESINKSKLTESTIQLNKNVGA